jgi:Putative transposase.
MNEGPKRKGIEIGYISVLEFFAANLWFTPHMHIVVPGLGLLNNGKIQKFISKEYLPTSLEILKEEFCTEFLKRLEDEYLGKAETRKDLLKDEPEKNQLARRVKRARKQ